jgi:hypothetical protein
MFIEVDCCPGFRDAPEPAQFRLGERRLAVRAIVDRWFAPAQRWFRVDAGDGDTYVLHHDEASGAWDLVAYTSAERARAAAGAGDDFDVPGWPGTAGYLRSPRSSM